MVGQVPHELVLRIWRPPAALELLAQHLRRRTLSRNQVIDPVQPTRSAITVAGMSGVVHRCCRTACSIGVNDVGPAGR